MKRSYWRLALTVPIVIASLPLLIVTAPVWIVAAFVVDLATGHRKLPSLRLGAFAVLYLFHEWVGVSAYGLLALDRRLRPRHDPVLSLRAHRRVQAWWAASLLRWAGRLLGLRLQIPDLATLPSGPFILASRHASMIDAIVPVDLIAARLDRYVHYVIKRELQWVPNVDLYGRKLGNYFVARTGESDVELDEISRLGATALPDSVLVIFPEGTFATPETITRVRSSLQRRGDATQAALATSLRHLLPPRPAGTLALMASQPELDVVILGHVGLEGVSRLTGLRRRLPLSDPIVVRWWHHPRHQLPTEQPQLVDWLNVQWQRLDTWIEQIKQDHQRPRGRT